MRSPKGSIALLALVLAACRTPDASPTPPQTSASASVAGVALAATPLGETVRLTLSNGSNGPVGYNLCTSAMLRREGTGWAAVPSEIVCTMEMKTLSSGASDAFTLPVAPGIEPGEYAWRASVEIPAGGARRDVISNPVALP